MSGADVMTAIAAIIAASLMIGAILGCCTAVILAHHRKGPR